MLSFGEIFFLYRARLRERTVVVQELLAVLGISVGVSLLFASQVASTSLDGSVKQLTKQIVGGTQYQLDARGTEGFPAAVVHRVQELAGVQAALPLVERPATIVGPSGEMAIDLIGADPRFVHAGGPLLKRFDAKQLANQQAIALPATLARSIGAGPLQTVKLQIGSSSVESLVGATLQEADIGALVRSQVAIAPISYAQRLMGMRQRLSRLFVQTTPGRRLEVEAGLRRIAAAHQLNLEPADFDARQFAVASEPAQQSEGLFSVISAIIGFLFAFTAMLLTVPERRRMIDDMRRRGTTRFMTVQALMFDALMIGALACILGLLLGDWLSVKVFHAEAGYLSFAFPVGSERVVTWPTVIEAAGAGMLAAFVGVLAPLRDILARPLRSPIAAEQVPRSWQVFRLAAGGICLSTTTFILIFRPQAAAIGSFTLIFALLVLLPFLFSGVLAVFDRCQRLLHASSSVLAATELRDPTTRVRSLAVAATGAIAVFGSVAITGAQRNLETGLDRAAHEWNKAAALWVSPAGIDNTLGTTAFPASVINKLRRLPSLRRIDIYRGSFMSLGDRRVWVIAPPRTSSQPVPAGQLTIGDASEVNARLRNRGWAVVSDAIGRELHLHIGDRFVLPSPYPMSFRLAGLSTNGGWPPGAIIMNSEDYAKAWGSRAASALNIDVAPGKTSPQARREVLLALGNDSGLEVQTAGERERQWKSISHKGLARLTQIATLVLVAAVLAMAGVMASMIWQRRDRIAYIKRQGYTSGLLWRYLFLESAVLLMTGCSIGAAFGLYGQLLLSHALTAVTGFPLVVGVGPLIALTSVAIVSLAALAIVALPGYLAARVRATLVKPA